MEREGEGSSSGWSCVTNWEVATGSSLEASISFDTSDEDAPPLTSDGTLLLRPASDDPPPCEVTVLFRGKHEIHRVYARTSATIFEMYYIKDADTNSTKEYLCTVKCGPVMSDENLQCSSRNSSVHSNEEENWVDVKVPGSSLKENLMHYEATAEISDAEPCVSIILRFLSLQTKSLVHVEEIYIYADPVDESSTTQNSSSKTTTGYSNTSSLFAMLVPNLLQVSKSGLSSRINERYFSPDRIHNTHDVRYQNAKSDSSAAEELRKEVVNHREEKNNCQTQKEALPRQMNVPVATDTVVPLLVQSHYNTSSYQKHASNSSAADARQVDQEGAVKTDPVEVGNTSNTDKSVEKLLEQLVFKVEKIETYFTKFEDKMLGPISCIESRLERLENQFSLLANDLQSLRIPLRETCPHATDESKRSQETMSQDDSAGDGVLGCQVDTDASTVSDGLAGCLFETIASSVGDNVAGCQVETVTSAVGDGVASCQVETKTSSGTTFKAPECTSEDESDDDGQCGNDDVHDDMEFDTHFPKKRKPISIDGALASALAAFATESSLNVSTAMNFKTNDPNLAHDAKRGGAVPSGPCPGVEGVPLVAIDDEIQIERASDLLFSFEASTYTGGDCDEVGGGAANLGANLHQVGVEDVVSGLGPTEETFEGSDNPTLVETLNDIGKNMNEDLHQVDGGATSEMGPTEGMMDDSDVQSHIEPVLFSKSVIGDVSDEEDVEPGFAPDSPRFIACNSLSSSDFELGLPNYGEVLKGWRDGGSSSTDSSFDETFLKTKMPINLSDDINTESSTFREGSQKFSVRWDEPKVLDPLAVLLDEMTGSDMSVPAFSTVVQENTCGANDPFIDLEGIPNSSEAGPADSNVPQFESLI